MYTAAAAAAPLPARQLGAPSARSRLEDEMQLRAVRAPGLQPVVGHGALDRRALVLRVVELEVFLLDPRLVEAELFAARLDDLVARHVRAHHHPSPRADRGVRHEDLKPPSLRDDPGAAHRCGLLMRGA